MSIAVEKGLSDEAHPEMFDERAMLPQSAEKKPGQQPDHVIKQYFEKVNVILFALKFLVKHSIFGEHILYIVFILNTI